MQECTPLFIIASVVRIVTGVVDRMMGDRVDYPLLVASGCVEALELYEIQSKVFYGEGAWVEILEEGLPIWAGCWGRQDQSHFWVASQYGEVIDLNVSVAHRKKDSKVSHLKSIYSPPMLWSQEVPRFYRYVPQGVAELDLGDLKDQRCHQMILKEIQEKIRQAQLAPPVDPSNLSFPNEPILCPGRKLLDDSLQSFRFFDRAIAVSGIPTCPI